jgi:hypothetical protein
MKDGGCVVLLNAMNDDLDTNRVCLTRLNKYGEELWTRCYNSVDTNIVGQEVNDLIQTPDRGFLITGRCFYTFPSSNDFSKPYFIKTDSSGVFEWETVVYRDSTEKGGYAESTTVNPDMQYFYSSITHLYSEGIAPALLKMDMSGNLINIYDVEPPGDHGTLTDAKFITNNTLAASTSLGNLGTPKAVIIDTLGNLLYQTTPVPSLFLGHVAITHDQKILYLTVGHNASSNITYLFKYNQHLESDSIYTQHYVYDSLCNNSIIPDTIRFNDCNLLNGIEDYFHSNSKYRLEAFPNPASNNINFLIDDIENNTGLLLSCFDINGRKVIEKNIPQGQSQIQVSVFDWLNGVYVAKIINDKGKVFSVLFVVNK